MSAKTYLRQVCEKIENLYQITLKCYGSPFEAHDHPEMDESDLLPDSEITKYQMLCGAGQWAVTIGWFSVKYAINSMARFAVAPKEGHLKRMFRIFG